MASETLEIAAARLVERLRSSPSDGIEERLNARTDRVKELREQAAAEWASCRSAIEGLIGDVSAQRASVLNAGTAFMDGLTELFPSLDSVAGEASGACEAATSSLQAAVPPLAFLEMRLKAEVQRWASEAGGFLVGIVEGQAQKLAGAQAAAAKAIGGDLRQDLQGRLDLLENWRAQAGEIADVATDALNQSYEEWAVRLVQVAELARSDGRERVSAHAARAAEAAVEDAPAAQQSIVASARTTLQSARESLAALATTWQGLPAQVAENLEPAFGAIDAVAEMAAGTLQELDGWTERLQLFAPEGAA